MRVFPQITDPVVLFSYFSIVVEISVWSVLIFKTDGNRFSRRAGEEL